MTAEIRELLVRAAEFLDNYADVEDGDYGVPRPNVAMALARDIEEALAAPSLTSETPAPEKED